jgi:hypothetical protein
MTKQHLGHTARKRFGQNFLLPSLGLKKTNTWLKLAQGWVR